MSSQFRTLFQLATEKIQARCRLDSFSGSVMQLHKDELLLFILKLCEENNEYELLFENVLLEYCSTEAMTKFIARSNEILGLLI